MVQVILGIIFLKQVPNVMEVLGMFCGLFGVLVIIFQKQKSSNKDTKDKEDVEL